jgi:5-methylcytosine-specific restriction endonuclease McrA
MTIDGLAPRALHPTLSLAILERDGYACAMCGSRQDLRVDRIVQGGADDSDNLRTLCRGCSIERL